MKRKEVMGAPAAAAAAAVGSGGPGPLSCRARQTTQSEEERLVRINHKANVFISSQVHPYARYK